jgi:hypothetical protein
MPLFGLGETVGMDQRLKQEYQGWRESEVSKTKLG